MNSRKPTAVAAVRSWQPAQFPGRWVPGQESKHTRCWKSRPGRRRADGERRYGNTSDW